MGSQSTEVPRLAIVGGLRHAAAVAALVDLGHESAAVGEQLLWCCYNSREEAAVGAVPGGFQAVLGHE